MSYGEEGYGRTTGGYGEEESAGGYGSTRAGGYGSGYGNKRDSDGDGIPDEFEKSQYNRGDVRILHGMHRLHISTSHFVVWSSDEVVS